MRTITKLSLAALAALVTAPAAEAAPTTTPIVADNPWLERRVLHFAHQGGEEEAPSDTLFALKTAVEKGADVLEIDVHATADREIVVLHDATVDRTTDGTGRVDELTLEQIKRLDAAYWFVPGCGTCHDRPTDAYVHRGFATGDRPIPEELSDFEPNDFTIPTLREVLETFPNMLINIEIKATAPETEPYEEILAALLDEFGRADDTIVVSFNDAATERFKLHNSEVDTATGTVQAGAFWASTQGPLPGTPNPRHRALQVPIEFNGVTIVTEEFVTEAHANGFAVHVWTIDDEATMRWLIEIGADGIMTNRPTLLEAVIQDLGVAWEPPKPCKNKGKGPGGEGPPGHDKPARDCA